MDEGQESYPAIVTRIVPKTFGAGGGDSKRRTTQPSRDDNGRGSGRGGDLSVAAAVGGNDVDNGSDNAARGARDLRPFSPAPPPSGDDRGSKHGTK
jgi:hypothetical protein